MEGLEQEIDGLYALPLDQFTAARDQLARSLRAEGQRDAATEVKRLRKPNLVGWALNQVRHRDPQRVEELIAAGARLQDAQQALVGGGERGVLRSAASQERRLVEEVVAAAEEHLAQVGHGAAGALQGKLWATAHAAAVGGEARDLLRAGRLVRDYELSDLGLPGVGTAAEQGAPAAPVAPKARTPQSRAGTDADRKAAAQRDREAAAVRRRLERARERATELSERLREAERGVAQAQREAQRAARALERAQTQAAHARAKASDAAEQARNLEHELAALGAVR
jgi:hypothetical protein